MKKALNIKSVLFVLAVMAVIAAVTVFAAQNVINSGAEDSGTVVTWGDKLKEGKYMHTSGDETKYIEVYSDGTLQIYGYSLYDETANAPINTERYKRNTEEELAANFEELKKLSDWFNTRHTYEADSNFGFVVFTDYPDLEKGQRSGHGVLYNKEKKALEVNDDNIYVYAG